MDRPESPGPFTFRAMGRLQSLALEGELVLIVVGTVGSSSALFSLVCIAAQLASVDEFIALWAACALALIPVTPTIEQALRPMFWLPSPRENRVRSTANLSGCQWTIASILLSASLLALAKASSETASSPTQAQELRMSYEVILCACAWSNDIPWREAEVRIGADGASVG